MTLQKNALLLCLISAVMALSCGCETIEEESIGRAEIEAAKDVRVHFSFTGSELNFRKSLQYVRGPRLIIEGGFQNIGRITIDGLLFEVVLFDEEGKRLEYSDVFSEVHPGVILPDATGRFKIDVPASQVKTVTIRACIDRWKKGG